MTHAVQNPDGLHNPTSFGYSHTARVPAGSELVFVSGQYASDPQGAVVSEVFAEQVERALHNLALALAGQGLELTHVAQLRTYVVGLDFEKLGTISGVVAGIWGETPPTQTLLGVAGLATPDMLFEIEAVAVRPV